MEIESILKEIQVFMSPENTKIKKRKDSYYLEYKEVDVDKNEFAFFCRLCNKIAKERNVAILVEAGKNPKIKTVKVFKSEA